VSTKNIFLDGGRFTELEAADLNRRTYLLMELQDRLKQFPDQKTIALALGISQPKVSKLQNGHIDAFSIGCLMKYLDALGVNTEFQFSESKRPKPSANERKPLAMRERTLQRDKAAAKRFGKPYERKS
jgi:predicted XRE-type DNA-binding protein